MTKVFTVVLERDASGLIVAKVPSIPGCATQGKTVEQALARIKEAIALCIETERFVIKPNTFIGIQQIEV